MSDHSKQDFSSLTGEPPHTALPESGRAEDTDRQGSDSDDDDSDIEEIVEMKNPHVQSTVRSSTAAATGPTVLYFDHGIWTLAPAKELSSDHSTLELEALSRYTGRELDSQPQLPDARSHSAPGQV